MKVAGITNQQEVYVVSDSRPFKINQILVIEDKNLGSLLGEVVETSSYNKYIPFNINGEMGDNRVLESLRALGYNIDENTIYIARLNLIVEAQYPVTVGSKVRYPYFDEVKDLLVKSTPERGLVLGVVKSTEELDSTIDNKYKDLLCLLQNGKVMNQSGIPFIFDIKSMQQYPHIGIFGGSGSGKSFGMRVILEEIMKLSIPTIVLDPHYEMDFSTPFEKLDFKYRTDFKDKFKCLQIGRHVGIKFSNLSVRDLSAILSAASPGSFTEPMMSVVEQLHKKGDTYYSFEERLMILKEAQEIGNERRIIEFLNNAVDSVEQDRYKRMVDIYKKYGTLPAQSVNGILWRLQRLNKEGLFTNDIKEIENCLMQGKTAVVQGPLKIMNVFSSYVITSLYHKRRDYRDGLQLGETLDYFPPFIIAFDECHNFVPKGYDTSAKSVIKEIAQEGRKYGVFLILATQRPALLDETVTAQLNTKLVFRTVRASDIDTIKEETDITSEEAKRLPYLQSGDTFISSAIFGRTVAVRIRMAKTTSVHTENPFDELLNMNNKKYEELFNDIKEHLPIYPNDLLSVLQNLKSGSIKDIEDLKGSLEALVDMGYIKKNSTIFGQCYESAV
ncbi:MAG: ATP-binding protein [Caloramator sp.]|nr:ATP-binding protein [Caloramator sp.]